MDITRQRVENRVNLFIELVSRLLAVFVWRGRAESEIGEFGLMLFYIGQLLSLHTQTFKAWMGSQSLSPADRLGLKKVLHSSSGGIHSECLFVPLRYFCHLILSVQVSCRLSSGELMTASRDTWNRWDGCSGCILGCDFASCLG